MPVPVGAKAPPELLQYLAELEARLSRLETPQGFLPLFKLASSQLTAASAAQNPNKWAIATDLKTIAWSDGAHWYRADTGAVII